MRPSWCDYESALHYKYKRNDKRQRVGPETERDSTLFSPPLVVVVLESDISPESIKIEKINCFFTFFVSVVSLNHNPRRYL